MNGSDIGSESRDTWNWLDGYQVNAYRGTLTNVPWAQNIGRTDDETIHWHRFACDLKPTSRRSTKIYATARRLQERVFFIQLDQLECGACTVPLLSTRSQVSRSWVIGSRGRRNVLCKFVVLVQPTLPRFLLCFSHLEWLKSTQDQAIKTHKFRFGPLPSESARGEYEPGIPRQALPFGLLFVLG